MKKEENSKIVHRNEPIYLEVRLAKKRYSEPKLFIPRRNGKPSVAPGDYWYVYFYWRLEPNGALDEKCMFKRDINRLKTAKERRAAGNALKENFLEALKRGWNPVDKTKPSQSRREVGMTLEKAINYAYDIKAKTRKGPTVEGYFYHKLRFLAWLKKKGLLGADPRSFTIDQFYEFMDWLRFDYVNDKTKEPLSGSSVNNHKASLSALFTTMKNERLIDNNFIQGIPKVDEDPVNNKAFSVEDIQRIKKELQKEDPYLIHFISFMLYPLLRPREICRLKVKDINTDKWFLTVETKTERLSHRRIIDKMKPTIEAMQLKGAPGDFHLFSNLDKPKDWSDRNLKGRANYFGKRFKKVKDKLGFGREYGLYSFRHTAILDLYNSMVDDGMGEQEILFKLMPITQHRSVAGIKNYLRKHKRSLPPDHSNIYTIDF